MRLQGKCVFLAIAAIAVMLSYEVMFASISSKFDAYSKGLPNNVPGWNASRDIPLTGHNLDVREERQFLACNHAGQGGCVNQFLPQSVAFAQAHPGHLYVLGDEYTGHCIVDDHPDPANCDRVTPQLYAIWYHQFTQAILAVDPTARFAPAGLAVTQTGVAETFRLYYQVAYGAPPPVYEWRFHGGELGPAWGIPESWTDVQNAAAWSVARGATMTWVFGFFYRNDPDLSAQANNLMALANADSRIGHVSFYSYDQGADYPQHNLAIFDVNGNYVGLTPLGTVYKNNSIGTPSSARNSVMEIGDFNADGKADYADHNTTTGAFQIHLNTGNGTTTSFDTAVWGPGAVTSVGADWEILVADFSGDGWADYADYHVPSGQIWIHKNTNYGTFDPNVWGYADMADGADYEVMAADIDGDWKADLVERQLSTGLIWYTPNIAGGSPFVNHGARALLGRSKNGPEWRIMLADFTGDGRADYADQYVPTGSFWVHKNIGLGNPNLYEGNYWMDNISHVSGQATAGSNWRTVVADFSGDGYAEYADLWVPSGGFWTHNYQPLTQSFVPSGSSSGFGQADPSKIILGSR
jgi:hypothetical protein